MIVANIACLTGATMFIFLNAYLIAEGMERWEIGLCEAGFWCASVFLQPWLGPQLDKRGRVVFLRLGVGLLIFTAVGLALAPPILVFMMPLRALQGAGFAAYLTSAWTWLSDHCPPDKVQSYFGIFGLSSLVGSVMGPGLAQLSRGNPPLDVRAFAVSAVILGVSLLVLFTLKDRPRSEIASKASTASASLWDLARRRSLRGPIFDSLTFGLAVGSIFAFAAAFMVQRGVEHVALIFITLTLVAGVGRGFCGHLSQRFGSVALVTPCLLFLAIGNFGLGSLQWMFNPPLLLLVGVGGIAGLGYGLVYPVLRSIVYERLHASERGRGMSLVSGTIDVGHTFGAVVAGIIAQNYGEGKMFMITGATVVITSLAAKVLDRSARKT